MPQIVGAQRLAGVDDFLQHVPAARHDDDEHARRAQRNEFDTVENRRLLRRPQREADLPRSLRHDVRGLREHAIDQGSRSAAPQARLDGIRRATARRRPLRFEEQVDVEAIAAIGRDAPGRRVWLLDVALFLEPREDAADGRRRHPEPGRAHQQ